MQRHLELCHSVA